MGQIMPEGLQSFCRTKLKLQQALEHGYKKRIECWIAFTNPTLGVGKLNLHLNIKNVKTRIKNKKLIIRTKTHSPVAVRLRTESELCHNERSVKGLACSAALRERYSCSMYSGYWPRTFTEALLRATPTLNPTLCPLRGSIEDTGREAVHRKTVHSSKVAPIFERWHSVESNDSQGEVFCCCLLSSFPLSFVLPAAAPSAQMML